MKNKVLIGLFVFTIAVVFSVGATEALAKDKIRVGWVTSLSGVNAPGVMVTSGNVYKIEL